MKPGDEITIRATVVKVVEGNQHPDYALVKLDRAVTQLGRSEYAVELARDPGHTQEGR